MKILKLLPLSLVALAALLLPSCEDKCTSETKLIYYEPVYATSREIRNSVRLEGKRDVAQPGRIYTKDNYLFVNEVGKGIHIFNNSNPSNPVATAFLSIPGNFDLAISGNTLFADSYVDIVVFDISNISQIKEVNRIESFLNGSQFYFYNETEDLFVVDWKENASVDVFESECNMQMQPWGGVYYLEGIAMASPNSLADFSSVLTKSTGTGGSMARFTINQDRLFVLDLDKVKAVDITSTANPVPGQSITLSWDIETIFPYGNRLFIGSQSGMHILDSSNPDQLTLLSTYQHLRSCDPVVVEGDLAYVTLRNGTECAGFVNQLEVINISDVTNPSLIAVYEMTNPHGLGIDEGKLFICDGAAGLRIFNAEDPLTIGENQVAHYENINALDIIPLNDVAMMIGEDGLYQYDYTDVQNVRLLSIIPFKR